MADGSPWWQSFFDDLYADWGLAGSDPQRLERTIDFLVDKLRVSPGDRVLDQCCGIGRLSLPLARRGLEVVGVDQAAAYVERARRAAADEGLDLELHHADAFEFVADPPCRAAVNWFTSFGYHEDDDVNVVMLRRVFESLAPGGRLALDYLNIPMICAEFKTSMVHRARPPAPQEVLLLDEPTPDLARGVIDSTWTFIHPDGRRDERLVTTRMFMPHELVKLARRAGFEDVELYGSIEGEPLELRSRRCILIAARGD